MLLHKTCMKCNHANPGTALPAGRRKGYFVVSRAVSTPRDDESRHSTPRSSDYVIAANYFHKPRQVTQKIPVAH